MMNRRAHCKKQNQYNVFNKLIYSKMKKILITIFVLCFYMTGICKVTEKKKTDALLKELSENACKSIDSIDTKDKSKEEIAKEANKCIDKYVGAYQIGSLLMGVDLSSPALNSSKKTININVNMDKNSEDYKKYYFEMETYLMDNCKALKYKLSANDIENEKSVSRNPKAIKEYSKGIKFFKQENYEKALPYFEKAIKEDSVFAFAWDNIGICNRKLNNLDAAIYAYNRSLTLDPNGVMPLQNIAIVYEYKKEYNKAITAYKTLSELDSFNPEVYYGIGRIYTFYLNDPENGLENICKAYTLYIKQKSPYRSDAEKLINKIYEDMKKLDKVARFNEILKENNIDANFN